ncbi:MAG TPA: peptidoglycan-binding protein [Longimicrobiaceae bacterium]|nr:peptidoglycan-binding protein [Longimicrobiaceae bacterium]
MAIWRDELTNASAARTLERARSAIGRNTKYVLGAGGMRPFTELSRRCDCSGFVAWAIGIPRQLPPRTGGWLDTDAYWRGGEPVADGLFPQMTPGTALPGDLFVYPDDNGRQGHIGIIGEVGANGPETVVHCSSGNYRRTGDAVQETSSDFLERHARSRIVCVDYGLLFRLFGGGSTPPLLRHEPLRGEPALVEVIRGAKLVAQGVRIDGCGAVQDALNILAADHPEYRVDLGPGDSERGYFGSKTRTAVMEFQIDSDIPPSGIIDATTLFALDDALG